MIYNHTTQLNLNKYSAEDTKERGVVKHIHSARTYEVDAGV